LKIRRRRNGNQEPRVERSGTLGTHMSRQPADGAADICIPASAYPDDLSVVDKMLGASVLASLGARLSQASARAKTG